MAILAMPIFPTMSPEEVADAGYEACISSRPVQIIGRTNKMAVAVGRIQPRWLWRKIAERIVQSASVKG